MAERRKKMNELLNKDHKLLITIVKKGLASKVVQASKDAGARGGTILFGRGHGVHEKRTFLGFTVDKEKEVILTVIPIDKMDSILSAVEKAGNLLKPSHGIGFVIDVKQVSGIAGMLNLCDPNNVGGFKMEETIHYDLIVTIINKGHSEKVVDASKKAGAEGGTIINGRGTGIREQAKLFSIPIEPEKEIVLTLIDRNKTDAVLQAIMKEGELEKPGKGIAFVLDVERTVGINHILNRMVNEKFMENN